MFFQDILYAFLNDGVVNVLASQIRISVRCFYCYAAVRLNLDDSHIKSASAKVEDKKHFVVSYAIKFLVVGIVNRSGSRLIYYTLAIKSREFTCLSCCEPLVVFKVGGNCDYASPALVFSLISCSLSHFYQHFRWEFFRSNEYLSCLVGLTFWHFNFIERFVHIISDNFEWPLSLIFSNFWVGESFAYYSLSVVNEGLIAFDLLNFGWMTHKRSIDIFEANYRWCGKAPLLVLNNYELATSSSFSYGPIGDARVRRSQVNANPYVIRFANVFRIFLMSLNHCFL